MKTYEEIRQLYLDNQKTIQNFCSNPEFILQNYKYFQETMIENRVLKNILQLKESEVQN